MDSIIIEPGPFRTNLFDNSPSNQGDPQLVATAIGELVDVTGERPLRTVVGADYGVNGLNEAVEPVQHGLLEALGMGAVRVAAA